MESTSVRVWKRLTREERLAAATAFWRESAADVTASALGAIVKARHVRPQVARAMTDEARAQALAGVLDPGESVAASLLVALHLSARRPCSRPSSTPWACPTRTACWGRRPTRCPAYVPETHQRLSIYQRVSQARKEDEIEPLRAELRDRYGPPPPEVEGLLRYAALRVRAEALAVTQVDASPRELVVRFDARTPLGPDALVRLARERPGATLRPDGLRWPTAGEPPMEALDGLFDRLRSAL